MSSCNTNSSEDKHKSRAFQFWLPGFCYLRIIERASNSSWLHMSCFVHLLDLYFEYRQNVFHHVLTICRIIYEVSLVMSCDIIVCFFICRVNLRVSLIKTLHTELSSLVVLVERVKRFYIIYMLCIHNDFIIIKML